MTRYVMDALLEMHLFRTYTAVEDSDNGDTWSDLHVRQVSLPVLTRCLTRKGLTLLAPRLHFKTFKPGGVAF